MSLTIMIHFVLGSYFNCTLSVFCLDMIQSSLYSSELCFLVMVAESQLFSYLFWWQFGLVVTLGGCINEVTLKGGEEAVWLPTPHFMPAYISVVLAHLSLTVLVRTVGCTFCL